jgi:hypothetical protein
MRASVRAPSERTHTFWSIGRGLGVRHGEDIGEAPGSGGEGARADGFGPLLPRLAEVGVKVDEAREHDVRTPRRVHRITRHDVPDDSILNEDIDEIPLTEDPYANNSHDYTATRKTGPSTHTSGPSRSGCDLMGAAQPWQ